MKKQSWPKIKPVTNHGRKVIQVDARIKGKGERRFFEKRSEAETWALHMRVTRMNQGIEGVKIPEALRIEALECQARLVPHNARLTDAVDFYLTHAKPVGGHKLLTDLVDEFIAAKRIAGRREEYLRVQSSVLGLFAKAYPTAHVHEVGPRDIEKWLASRGGSLRTRSNYQKDVSNLFNFAVRHGYTASNPVQRLEKVTLDDLAIQVLSVDQTIALLRAARDSRPEMVPFIAIGLFAGLRTREIAVLDWKDVSIRDQTITVHAAKTKTRSRRIVEMSDNLVFWLKKLAQPSGPVTPDNYRTGFEVIREAAKISPWPRDAMRHSFASYHYAAHRDEEALQAQMGHESGEMLVKHYRELVKPSAGKEYFSLVPR